jgi:hypothetical protein
MPIISNTHTHNDDDLTKAKSCVMIWNKSVHHNKITKDAHFCIRALEKSVGEREIDKKHDNMDKTYRSLVHDTSTTVSSNVTITDYSESIWESLLEISKEGLILHAHELSSLQLLKHLEKLVIVSSLPLLASHGWVDLHQARLHQVIDTS